MKNFLLILVSLLFFAPASFGQANTEKQEVLNARDAEERYAWRTKTGNWANSGGENYFYPAMYMYWGKGMTSEGLAKITVGGKAGFVDRRGKIVIRPPFKDSGAFSNGLAPVETENDKWGFIDTKGNMVVEPIYDWAFGFYSATDLARVQLKEKWGYIDKKGALIIKPQFDDAAPFREGLAAVEIKGKWGFIDTEGNQVIPPQFDRASFFSEGLAVAALKVPAPLPTSPQNTVYKWGFIDRTGKWIIEPSWDGAVSFFEGWARVWKRVGNSFENSEDFLIDRNGKVIWNENSFTIRWYASDMMVVRMEGENVFNLVDRSGKHLTERTFDDVGYFSEGVLAAATGEKYGFINKKGDFVIPPKYDFAMYFREGLALVKEEKKYGYIDAKGKYVIRPIFEYAWPFGNGAALVANGEKTGYIDRTGKYIWKPTK